MERVMAILTHKEQAFVWPVRISRMATNRTRLTGIVGVYFDSHTLLQERFIGNHGLQLSKRPLGVSGMSFPLLLTALTSAFGALSNACQIFQSDETVGLLGHDTFGDCVIGVGF